MEHRPRVDQVVPTGDGLRRQFFVADQGGQAYGLETMVRMRHEGFYGWVTYTLSRSERWDAQAGTQLFAFDQTHVLNIVASYGFEGWRSGDAFSSRRGVRSAT